MRILMIVFSAGILSLNTTCYGQNWNEWFRQKKTQKKYLIEQIIALQTYIGYVRKGYDIAQKGLTVMSGIKNGDLNLHRDFFNALDGISPAISHYAKVADIIALQVRIIQVYHHTYSKIKGSSQFSPQETDYIYRVYGRLLEDCDHTADALVTVTTSGKLEMTDDERLQRINRLYQAMQDSYTFCQDFSQQALLLAASRMNEENEAQTGRTLYGIQ